jgi:hypothetical protein
VVPPRSPRKAPHVVSPYQLQGKKFRSEEFDGECHTDIGGIHLNHLDEEPIFEVDVHRRRKLDAAVDDHLAVDVLNRPAVVLDRRAQLPQVLLVDAAGMRSPSDMFGGLEWSTSQLPDEAWSEVESP